VLKAVPLQWQENPYNTGGLFFYPDKKSTAYLSPDYHTWQNQTHAMLYDSARIALNDIPANARLHVEWKGLTQGTKLGATILRGILDLRAIRRAMADEFQQALATTADQSKHLPPNSSVNFKFMKAGMGLFASGINHDVDVNRRLLQTRLEAIALVLEDLAVRKGRGDPIDLGQIKRLELPCSDDDPRLINRIKIAVKALGLTWGGTPDKETPLLAPIAGYVTAITNCASAHAALGNGHDRNSVDAEIGNNVDVRVLNPGLNDQMTCKPMHSLTPEPQDREKTLNFFEENNFPDEETAISQKLDG